MAEVERIKKAFTKYYAKLTEALPMDDLLAELYANELLPGDRKAEIESRNTRKQKAQCFLDEVIKPGLSIGYTGQFNKMISVMESSDDPVVKYLANQIQEYIHGVSSDSSSSSTSDDNGVFVYYFVHVANTIALNAQCSAGKSFAFFAHCR